LSPHRATSGDDATTLLLSDRTDHDMTQHQHHGYRVEDPVDSVIKNKLKRKYSQLN
jgi:hypothetical protein